MLKSKNNRFGGIQEVRIPPPAPFILKLKTIFMDKANSELENHMAVNTFDISVLDSLTAHIAVLNAQGIIVAVNKAWRQFGAENGFPESSHSLLGANYLDTCKNAVNQSYGDEANAVQAGITSVLAGEQERFYLEYPCHSPNKCRWFSMVVLPLQDSRGGVVVSHENITERKQMVEKLREHQELLKSIIDCTPSSIFSFDLQHRFTLLNDAMAKFYGLPKEEILGKTLHDVFPSELADRLMAINSQILATGESLTYEEVVMSKFNNIPRYVITSKFPLRDANGKINGLGGVATDITERKQTEVKLRDEQKRITAILETIGNPIFVKDNDYQVILANHAFYNMFGLHENTVIGNTLAENIPADEMRHFLEVDQRVLDTGIPEQCEETLTVRGNTIIALTTKTRFINDSGEKFLVGATHDITDRVKMEQALLATEKEFRLLAESMPQIVWITRADGESIYLNQQWVDYTGLSLEESYGHNWSNALHPDDRQRAWNAWQIAIKNKSSYSFECQIRRADGVYRWWLDRGVPVCDETGEIYKWFGTCTDIHELKESEKSLRIAAIAFESQEAMFVTDANQVILNVNQAFTRITGYSGEDAVGNTPALLKSGNQDEQFYDTLWETLNHDKFWTGEIWNRRKNGELYPEWLSISAVTDANGRVSNYIGAFTDITESKKLEETIHHLAFYDPLTHLPNRRLMRDRLQQALISRKLKSRYGAIFFIDLNDFKILNDTKGYDSGDLLLIKISSLLQASVHEDDTVARTGGNEFVVLVDALDISTELAATQAEAIAKRILAAISQPFNLRGYEYRCSASIGIALFHSHTISVDELIKQADMAMHQAKKVGKNTLCFFDLAIQEALEFRVQLEAWMHKALNEQYELYYQLQVDDKGKATGAEALIRWNHPEQGMISPADFIPLAEQTGLILPIGQWVLETACTQLKAWEHQQNTEHLVLAVNVSAKQFTQKDFVNQVLATLEKTGANPNKLKLELTESMLATNIEDIIAKMNVLRVKGVKFSLDDFGTGFSSLSYLKRLPLDQLKIDQSFVRDALTDPNDAAIINAVIALGQSLGMEVIAEGVETQGQRTFLGVQGCTHYQGYFFSRPLPLKEFEQLLHNKSDL